MVGIDVLHKLIFPTHTSILVMAMSFITFVSLANGGFMEFKGKHVRYSKFFNLSQTNPTPRKQTAIPSRGGMLMLYIPPFLFGVASFLIFSNQGLRFFLLRLALTIHFLKRALEVLLVHKYGNSGIDLEDAIPIALSYALSTVTMIYAQHLSSKFPEPSIDLKYAGAALFLLGIGGNFYHHCILATLRQQGEKGYKIPRGGLFNRVVCPHYLFEVLGFVGVSCIAQTLYALSFTAGTALYLLGRSYGTRQWYLSKFEDFPKNVKAMIPFIF